MKLRFWKEGPVERKGWSEDWPWSTPPPASWNLIGGPMSLERAMGLPALLGVVMRLSQGVGMVPQLVYRDGKDVREKAADSWQWNLLHRAPSSESTPFSFRADMAASIAGSGGCYVRKFKGGSGRVRELIVLDSEKVTPVRVAGQVVFEDRTGPAKVTRSRDEILFVRGMALNGKLEPVSPIGVVRERIGAGLARNSFESSYMRNHARPDVAVVFPAGVTREQAREWREEIDSLHGGSENFGKPIPLGGGADIKTVPISLKDAQFVEAAQMSAQELAGVYAMPKSFLGIGDLAPTDVEWRFFLTFGLGWILAAIDQAFNADQDLFPAGDGLFCEALPDALLKQDPKERADTYRLQRQGGWITANEIRRTENRPPVAGGDEIQQTPVGGAANPADAGGKGLDELADAVLARLASRAARELTETT